MFFGFGSKYESSTEVRAMEEEKAFLIREIEILNRRKREIEMALASQGVSGFFKNESSSDGTSLGWDPALGVLLLLMAVFTTGCSTFNASNDDLIGPGSPEWEEPYIEPPLERPHRQRNIFSGLTDNLPTRSINDVDDAYQRGQADEIKRLYFARNNIERAKAQDHGSLAYYTFPGPRESSDGVRLVPHEVTVPILE